MSTGATRVRRLEASANQGVPLGLALFFGFWELIGLLAFISPLLPFVNVPRGQRATDMAVGIVLAVAGAYGVSWARSLYDTRRALLRLPLYLLVGVGVAAVVMLVGEVATHVPESGGSGGTTGSGRDRRAAPAPPPPARQNAVSRLIPADAAAALLGPGAVVSRMGPGGKTGGSAEIRGEGRTAQVTLRQSPSVMARWPALRQRLAVEDAAGTGDDAFFDRWGRLHVRVEDTALTVSSRRRNAEVPRERLVEFARRMVEELTEPAPA